MRAFDEEQYPHQDLEHLKTRRALYAAWWFIENVNDDVPDRTDIFFEVRKIVRTSDVF